jgi:hypothetical protein
MSLAGAPDTRFGAVVAQPRSASPARGDMGARRGPIWSAWHRRLSTELSEPTSRAERTNRAGGFAPTLIGFRTDTIELRTNLNRTSHHPDRTSHQPESPLAPTPVAARTSRIEPRTDADRGLAPTRIALAPTRIELRTDADRGLAPTPVAARTYPNRASHRRGSRPVLRRAPGVVSAGDAPRTGCRSRRRRCSSHDRAPGEELPT